MSSFRNQSLAIVVLAMTVSWNARADDNLWINPGSGAWENAANWSLGMPGSNLWMVIDNPGWKAVGISANTANNFPSSMTVQRVVVGSPVDSFNVLLLNYAGYSVPFRANEIIISNNAAMTVLGSVVQVTNTGNTDYRIEVSGTLNHGDNSSVNTTTLSVGNFGGGVYNLTNGALYGATEYIGGAGYSATFNQFGGYHSFGVMRLNAAAYHLAGGSMGGGNIQFYGGAIQQDAGYCDASLSRWNYTLNGGIYTNAALTAGYSSEGQYFSGFTQNGGSNLLGSLSIGQQGYAYDSSRGTYYLNNGYLIDGGTSILGDGGLVQTGGVHQVNGDFFTDGVFVAQRPAFLKVEGYVELSGGMSVCDNLKMTMGSFSQTGGTNIVKQTIICSNYTYNTAIGYMLSGGTLQSSNVALRNPFHQSGGLHQISSTLSLSGTTAQFPPQPVRYYMSGTGALYAPQIAISNLAEFSHTGGAVLNNSYIQLAGGSWLSATGSTTLGQLALGTFGTNLNSYINLATNTALQFANSSGQSWDGSGRLIIQNWQGSINGNGQNSIKFGPGGLTPQQVALVQFDSPRGVGSGLYPARLLPSGELVPDRAVFWRRGPGGALVLEWPAGATLQSSTNVTGPYVDLPGATSPYTNHSAAPRLFFRLRM